MRYTTQPNGTYGGFIGNQGAIAGGNPLLDPRFKIQGGEPWNKTPLLPGKDTKEYEEKQFNLPSQPLLPSAGFGNEGGLVAQTPPGMGAMGGMPPAGNIGGMANGLGGPMTMGPRFGPRPLNLDINAVDDRLESIGGSANIELDPNQTLRFGGSFNPAFTDQMGMQNPQSYTLYGEYTTPGLGVNVNYRNTGRGSGPQNMSMPGGFPGEIQAGVRGRF